MGSGRLGLRVALELVELDAVEALKAFAAELAGERVVQLAPVLLHVPVEGGTLPALVPADLAPRRV